MTEPTPFGQFYRRDASGRVRCTVCRYAGGTHREGCPVVVVHTQVQELTGQLGGFVLDMREALERLDQLARGVGLDAPEGLGASVRET